MKIMYEKYIDTKNWTEQNFGAFNYADELYFQAELDRCDFDFALPIKVYEIGFGNGAFAGWVASKGLNYCGSELLGELVERGLCRDLDVFNARDEEKNIELSSIDLIVAWDVFEHLALDDLISSLDKYKSYLKPGGLILARVPSGDSPFSASIFNGDITHKILLGSNAVRQIARKCGYDVLEISAPKLPVRGLGFKRGIKRLVVLVSQWFIGKLINIIFHNNDECIITSNMVFILSKSSDKALVKKSIKDVTQLSNIGEDWVP